ncbi:MAG: succinylglutamate desuccinylase/aspartoacylase family protein [Vicinamibacterales bacterium]|nr:succinylglutamate desuccinylase/aspartoacylase family protein [Vicinamibacterales bacterium]
MPDLVLAGTRIAAGTRAVVRLPVAHDLTGPVDIVTHGVAGRHDGPTLLLLSMLHGNEWFSALVVRAIVDRLDPATLRGHVLAVPVANAPAMLTHTRCIQDDADEPDANRTFGGPYQWLSNQVTRAISDHLFPLASAIIDYHVGDWGATMADVSWVSDFSDPAVSARSRALAVAYGFPVLHSLTIHSGLRGPRTSLGFAGERFGIPGVVAEVGGLGFGEAQEQAWIARNVEGTLGVMRALGMIDGAPPLLDRYLEVHDYWRVGPKAGGYLEPVMGLDRQFTDVHKGDLMARVIDPRTFDIVDEVHAPGHGTIFYACRAHMIRPGGWAYGVANREDGRTGWVTT